MSIQSFDRADDSKGDDDDDDTVGKSRACLPVHCFRAFDSLYCALTSAQPIEPQFVNEKYPLFVAWYTRSSRMGGSSRLRGCIGSFEALELHSGLAEYALISAFKDHRFRRVEEHELEKLECCVSLLTDFEDADSYLDWTIGVHGIHITFPHPSTLLSVTSPSSTPSPLSSSWHLPSTRFSTTTKRTFSATYLPEVMPEQEWTRVETIDSAIQKAGWDGRITEDLRRSVRLRRYQSSKCSVSWDKYWTWRTAQLSPGEDGAAA